MQTISLSTPRARRAIKGPAVVAGAFALWAVLALLAPELEQAHGYHAFADQRAWGWMPNAMDVLSNLGFLMAALWGAWRVQRTRVSDLSRVAHFMALVFFAGLALSFAGSSYYHWAPDNASLVWDRLAMCVPFAGMLGLAVQQTFDDDSALMAGGGMLLAALTSVLVWEHSGNMMPWAVAQGLGMVALVVLACMRRRADGLQISLGMVIGFYAVAKVCELGDAQIFELDGMLSGHSLKHLLAACAAWPVLRAFAMHDADSASV
ncbi:hypothetical protein [Diaphorobacter sp.]|uniref:hypothetical protein n=1 Tax=Diaphorobacter sp. TaxID=1934310 RepID=UPI0028B005A4|nr:hypothetical protein [Diaphorobacter sp.]